MKRAIIIVIDSMGIGAMDDCAEFNDTEKCNTLKNVCEFNNGLHLPNLEKLGLGNIQDFKGVKPIDDIILRNEQDVEMNHFIVQAIVNKVDYMGYRKIYCSNKRLIPYLNKFVKSDLHEYTYMADLTEYFKHSCQNQHKNN